MLSFMLFTFLGFLCVVSLLVYLLYTQEKICRTLRDEHAEMRLLLRAVESQLKGGDTAKADGTDTIAHDADTLLKLDFSTPLELKKRADADLDLHLDPKVGA